MKTFADFDFTPDDPDPDKIREIYESGFMGAFRIDGEVAGMLIGGTETFYDAYPQARGLHTEMAVCMPIRGMQAVLGQDFCADRKEGQRQGDSLPSGTMIRMADGTEKPIEEIQPGDYVISHLNKARRVLSVFKKTWNKSLVRIRAKGCARSLTTTDTHELVSYPGIHGEPKRRGQVRDKTPAWVPMAELDVGSHVSLPYGVDESVAKDNPGLAWLVGFFLAEGCVHHSEGKAVAISFNTDARRTDLHDKVRLIVRQEFGVDVYDTYVNDNNSCLQLRTGQKNVVKYFKKLCDKKAHNKFVPDAILAMGRKSRLACLQGWMDGDGCHTKANKLVGSSMSNDLARGMQRLALSCGVRANYAARTRKGSDTSYMPGVERTEYEVAIGWGDASRVGLLKEAPPKQYRKVKHVVEEGIALPIAEYERVPCEDGFVYCLQVEVDHGFISNGYATKNCVGKLLRNQGMMDGVLDHMFGETDWPTDPETGLGVQYCDENHYGSRGHGGEGANCQQLWSLVTPDGGQGFIHRGKYGEYDLSSYRPDLSGPWGRRGVPGAVTEAARKNPALQVYRVRELSEYYDAISLGFSPGRCGSQGYSSKRNEDGLSERTTTWNHAICVGGFVREQRILDKYDGPMSLWYHNWSRWNSGPKAYEQPDGSWFVREREVISRIEAGSMYVVASVVGLNRKLIWERAMDRRSDLIGKGIHELCTSR